MSKLIVQITSKDVVRPSCRTSNHLKTLKLSSLDQISNPVWMPLVFYFKDVPINRNNTTTLLKKSLSETLVQYYPLAGAIEGNLSIDCNDKGVVYYEASVLASLQEIIDNPNHEELIKLSPFSPLNEANNSRVAGVQVNHFSCGGMAICVTISHKVADAQTTLAFFNAWADNARGDGDVSNYNATQVKFDSESLFPQINPNEIDDPESAICKEKTAVKRLLFDKEKLDMLRKRCIYGQEHAKSLTRAEVVSAFVWKEFIKAAQTKPKPPKVFGATQVVGLRNIKSTPIPRNYHGNLFRSISAYAQVETETKYSELVDKLRTAVKKIDKTYIKALQAGEFLKDSHKGYENLTEGELDFCYISNCSRLPQYEANFGWGTPIWVSMTKLPFKNTVFLWSTKCGKGIEAWVYVLEQDVPALEQDPEFLSLACHTIQAKL